MIQETCPEFGFESSNDEYNYHLLFNKGQIHCLKISFADEEAITLSDGVQTVLCSLCEIMCNEMLVSDILSISTIGSQCGWKRIARESSRGNSLT